jgi:hypothetical protein
LTVTNSTLSGNNGGPSFEQLYLGSGTLNLGNTIIANSLSPNDCFAAGGTFNDLGNNLIENTGAGACGLLNGVNGNIIGSDPLLGPLADNGGPTLTHMPRVDSPAVDAGNCDSGPAADQRGLPRPQNATCDIGAVEAQSGEDEIQICDVVAGETYFFGASGVQLTIDTVGTLSCINVAFVNGEHSNATDNIAAPYVTISPVPVEATDFEVSMTLLHPNYANPQICQYPGNMGGYGWYCTRLGFDDHTVWRGDITSFSDWAVGDNVGPTAVTLNALLTTIGGAALPWLALTLLLISLTVTAVWRGRQPT